jgi:hypothetical protein
MTTNVSTHQSALPDTTPARSPVPVPISPVGTGSGGINLLLTYRLYMHVAGRGYRLQPPLLVNYNDAEQGRIRQLLESASGRGAILPKHTHTNPEGFGGDPTAWKDEEGAITLDLEHMVTRAQDYAHRIGAPPGLILELVVAGGGHAELGLIVHQAIRQGKFPNALYLPVCLIPDQPSHYGWMRSYTWERFERCLAGIWGLWIDNAALPPTVMNDLLAIALTSLDTCSSSMLTAGSLRQAVAGLRNAITHQYSNVGTGFLRLGVLRRPLRSKKGWRWGFPLRQRKVIRTSTNALEDHIRTAIRDCLETPIGLLDTNPLPVAGIPQVVAVSAPVKPDALSDIAQRVQAILAREEWWQAHKDTTNLLWGAINFPDPVVLDITKPEKATHWLARLWRAAAFLLTMLPRLLHRVVFGRNHRQKDLYITVTRLFPELGALIRLQSILQAAGQTNGSGATGAGFGTHQHQVATPVAENSHKTHDPVR